MADKNLKGLIVGGCEILDELGSGGMGVIYRARQVSLDRHVALKVLAPRLAGDAVFVERFFREAKAIARINHSNILSVYDVGVDGDMAYMVIELVDGQSLNQYLKDKGVLDPWMAADCIRQSAEGLAAAYSARIIHRDIKPDNLMLTRENVVKVSDFGLAKEVETTKTETGLVMGTPAYMSPEQCDGKTLDARSDIYSLGGTFYRLITGRLPFEAETAMSMMYKHKHEDLIPPCEVVRKIPQGISDLIVHMMAKERERRPASMVEVVERISTTETDAANAPVDAERTLTEDSTGRLNPRMPGRSRDSAKLPRFSGGITAKFQDPPSSSERPTGRESSVSRQQEHPSGIMGPPRSAPSAGSRQAKELKAYLDRGHDLMKKAKYAEAVRSFRAALALQPPNAKEIQALLDRAEKRMMVKRKATGDLRALIQASKFSGVVQFWDNLDEDLRDNQLRTQVEHIRDVTLPAARLCDAGDRLLEKGRLSDAEAQFQEALEVEAECARARQGLKDIDTRRHRVNSMLKEGFEHLVKEEFDQAVKAWMPIFKITPRHSQALKHVVDAHLRAAQKARSRGDLEEAVRHWRGILNQLPDHAEARPGLERDASRVESIKSLNEAATRAYAEGKLGRALRTWKQALVLNPQNKGIQANLARTRKRHRGKSLRRTAVWLLLLAILMAMLVAYYQWQYTKNLSEGATLRGDSLDAAYQSVQESQRFPGHWMGWFRKGFVNGVGMDPEPLEREVQFLYYMETGKQSIEAAHKDFRKASEFWSAQPPAPEDAVVLAGKAEAACEEGVKVFDLAATHLSLDGSLDGKPPSGRSNQEKWKKYAEEQGALRAWADFFRRLYKAHKADYDATRLFLKGDVYDTLRVREESVKGFKDVLEYLEVKQRVLRDLPDEKYDRHFGDMEFYLGFMEDLQKAMASHRAKKFAAAGAIVMKYASSDARGHNHPAIQRLMQVLPERTWRRQEVRP